MFQVSIILALTEIFVLELHFRKGGGGSIFIMTGLTTCLL